jgi:hypothetical protein
MRFTLLLKKVQKMSKGGPRPIHRLILTKRAGIFPLRITLRPIFLLETSRLGPEHKQAQKKLREKKEKKQRRHRRIDENEDE